MRIGLLVSVLLFAATLGCDEAASCLHDADCGPGHYCDNVLKLVSETCVEAPRGKCQVLSASTLGAACSTDGDCKEDSFACLPSSGTCGVLACPQAAAISCPAGCVAGGRPWCAACTCPSCSAANDAAAETSSSN